MIKFAAQMLFTIAVAIGAIMIMGLSLYIGFEVVLTLVVFGCLMAVPGRYDANEPGWDLAYVAKTFATAVFLGLIWPSLPIIVLWGDARRKAEVDASRAADQRAQ